MQDLTSVEWESQYALVESYFKLLQVGKEQQETSCVDQLMKSDGFMKIVRSRYAELVEKARKEVIEEGEESYFTQLVHCVHFVFGKAIE
ncbi:uncharacterized protein [Blastocystis hominis]|uniref:Cullin N-terminal domain-containing protein n=1 Tax=Blastocystis hominis TaxID=12968 RepID=D8M3V5_BLAHO|nr:uncharacterized protein [Blastocystis hominis]XP_012897958.1 uncharacterized protein [Blastocystis hominis]CBK22578.2 unnamed protein product [Blastocystis hominis]CBK23910.2 unnamed protein product [Blastocystis hominis]|eukprot:XP_012896626.1 uncharacterized protein [Blastocystis hominis]